MSKASSVERKGFYPDYAAFIRKTNGFSKRLRQHRAAVALYVAHSNSCRIHAGLRVTPAMALDVAERAWSVGDLIMAALSIAPACPDDLPAPTKEQLKLLHDALNPSRRSP